MTPDQSWLPKHKQRASFGIVQAPTGVPTTLRTGRGHISASSEPQRKIGAATLVAGEAASPCTWRGLTRLALVGLVAAEEPLHSEPAPLAETLALDARTPLLLQAARHGCLRILQAWH